MANISTYFADKLLDHGLGTTAYAKPTVYVSLFTVAPAMPGGTGGTEVVGGAYVREELTTHVAAASGGSAVSNADVAWPTASADWGTVVGFGLHDAPTAGNLLAYADLTVSKPVSSGDTYSMPAGDITAALA